MGSGMFTASRRTAQVSPRRARGVSLVNVSAAGSEHPGSLCPRSFEMTTLVPRPAQSAALPRRGR